MMMAMMMMFMLLLLFDGYCCTGGANGASEAKVDGGDVHNHGEHGDV